MFILFIFYYTARFIKLAEFQIFKTGGGMFIMSAVVVVCSYLMLW